MNRAILELLRKNEIIIEKKDFYIMELANVNPYKKNVIKIYSKFKKKSYIIKKCGTKEIKNLKICNSLLSRSELKNVEVLKPLGGFQGFYIFDDIGTPLNKKKIINKSKIFDAIMEINDIFIDSGYWWGGLALRNIFFLKGKYVLIDFEKFFRIKSVISKRHLLFLRINLRQSFAHKQIEKYINKIKKRYVFSNSVRRMDRVEKIGWEVLNFEDRNIFLDAFDEITIRAESPFLKDDAPFKIGHIVDEIASPEISFLWTMLMHRMRGIGNIKNFEKFIKLSNRAISLNDKKNIKVRLASMIIASGRKYNYGEVLKMARYAKLNNSVKSYDKILKLAVESICDLVKINFQNISLIARGSYGECILNDKSDLDFEIVDFSKGDILDLIAIERLTCAVLGYLGFRSEGTLGRPKEKDVILSDQESRDLFEIFELRLVSGNKDVFADYIKKYKDVVYKKKKWKKRSQYERGERRLNPKSLFESIRFLITRLAILSGKNFSYPETYKKIKICPAEDRKIIRDIMKDIIVMIDGNSRNLEMLRNIKTSLDELNFKYEFPTIRLVEYHRP